MKVAMIRNATGLIYGAELTLTNAEARTADAAAVRETGGVDRNGAIRALQENAGCYAEEASELAEYLALPDAYFSPRGGEHWHRVASRQEVEEAIRLSERMVAYYEAEAAALAGAA